MGLFGKKEITIVDAWVIARTIAEDTIEILDIKRLSDLDDEFASGNIARLVREPLFQAVYKGGEGSIDSREGLRHVMIEDLKNYSNFRINSDQFEEIFVQSFTIVCNHFAYKTEEARLKSGFLPFRKIGSLGGAKYFTDKVFDAPTMYQISPELKHLKSFPMKNYNKPLIGKELSLDQAKSITIIAASNIIFEMFQRSFVMTEDSLDEAEDEILAFVADEVAWQIYRNFYCDYRWSESQTMELLEQTTHLISSFGEKLLNDRGRFLDINRYMFNGGLVMKTNTTPSWERLEEMRKNPPKPAQPHQLYIDETFLKSFKNKKYKHWKESQLIREFKYEDNIEYPI